MTGPRARHERRNSDPSAAPLPSATNRLSVQKFPFLEVTPVSMRAQKPSSPRLKSQLLTGTGQQPMTRTRYLADRLPVHGFGRGYGGVSVGQVSGFGRMSVRTRQGGIATPVRPRLPRGCDQLFLRVRTTRAKACADRRRKDPQLARDPQPSYVPKRARARNSRRPSEPPTACQSSFRRRCSARLRSATIVPKG
jgi:hypothetical protein